MNDFTLNKYSELISALKAAGYEFQSFEDFLLSPRSKTVILRHDIDKKAPNSLKIAEIEADNDIHSTYYFRVFPQSNNPDIIREIVRLGNEVGYHYEDLVICKGDKTKAINHFEKQLNYFKTFYHVKTICMNGSPTSKIDNRTIWQEYNYRDFGIVGEPYFDVDFDKVLYLTDTGRCWDGERFSVRDKVKSSFNLHFHTTDEIIAAAKAGELPNQIMITTHPQRWTNNYLAWLWELVLQTLKNQVKRCIIR